MIINPAFNKLAVGAAAALIAMSGTLIGQIAPPVISSSWLIDVRSVAAVGTVVISGTWWLSKKFQVIEDKLASAEEARKGMQEALAKLISDHENNHPHR